MLKTGSMLYLHVAEINLYGILAPSSIPFRLQALSEDILVRVAKRI